jgi:tetratricopeptide (TPR) repeat protein
VSKASQESTIIVEDVVSALTGPIVEGVTEERDLADQMERAAAEFDKRTASAFGRALLDSLCEDPGNLRQLEALIILGLAHPDVLGENRISLAVEGRRLAVLLERSGEVDRARGVLELLANRMPDERTIDHELAGMMRRSGNTEELVERYVRRAEDAISDGNISEAIPWLQEVLLLDRTRRDVARMIRDLRYQESDRVDASRRRSKLLIGVTALTAFVTMVVGREVSIHRQMGALPIVREDDHAGLEARRASIETLVEHHGIWTGVMAAREEIEAITVKISQIEAAREDDLKRQAAAHANLTAQAEAERMEGLVLSEKGDFEGALGSFSNALELAPVDWDYRDRVQTDVTALRKWKAARR